MKQILFYILFSLFTCLTICAEPYTPESLPNVFDRTTRVANPDGLLSQAAVDSINSMLLSLDSHEVQCIVVVVNNIKGDDPYEFAMGLGRRFGVGGEKNLGIVLVLATDDRSYEMITGDGMEKFLPDIICHRIQEHPMVPLLKKSDWDGAMVATVRAIKGYLEEDPEIMELYLLIFYTYGHFKIYEQKVWPHSSCRHSCDLGHCLIQWSGKQRRNSYQGLGKRRNRLSASCRSYP